MFGRLSFAALAAIMTTATGALASDLPARNQAPLPPLVTQFNWTGFYAGLHAGYGGVFSDTAGIHTAGGVFDGNVGSTEPKGFLGGGQLGYNYQSGNIVYGLEGDISFTSRNSTASSTLLLTGLDVVKAKENVFGSVRGRLGYAVDRTLFYVTGGVGITDFKSFLSTGGGASVVSKSSTRVGFAGGAGIEYAFTNNITARIEGLYYQVPETRTTNGAGNFTRPTQSSILGRVAVNYKF